jgi:hypothetical protein
MLLLVQLGAIPVAGGQTTTTTTPTSGGNGLCDSSIVNNPVSGLVAGPACEAVVGTVTGTAGEVVGGVASAGAGALLEELAEAFGDAATSVLGAVWGLIDSTTEPPLDFESDLAELLAGFGFVMLPLLFIIAICQSAIASSYTAAGKAVLMAVIALALIAGIPLVVTMLLGISDFWSELVVAQAGSDVDAFFSEPEVLSASAGTAGAAAASPMISIFAAGFVVVGTMTVWMVMIMRSASIVIAALLLPLAFAGIVMPSTRVWARRAAEVLVAVIFSKVVITLAFALAAQMAQTSVVEHQGVGANVNGLLVAGAMTLLAASSPVWLYKFVHMGVDRAAVAVASQGPEVSRAAGDMKMSVTQASAPVTNWFRSRSALSGGGSAAGGGGGSGGGGGATPPPGKEAAGGAARSGASGAGAGGAGAAGAGAGAGTGGSAGAGAAAAPATGGASLAAAAAAEAAKAGVTTAKRAASTAVDGMGAVADATEPAKPPPPPPSGDDGPKRFDWRA